MGHVADHLVVGGDRRGGENLFDQNAALGHRFDLFIDGLDRRDSHRRVGAGVFSGSVYLPRPRRTLLHRRRNRIRHEDHGL